MTWQVWGHGFKRNMRCTVYMGGLGASKVMVKSLGLEIAYSILMQNETHICPTIVVFGVFEV